MMTRNYENSVRYIIHIIPLLLLSLAVGVCFGQPTIDWQNSLGEGGDMLKPMAIAVIGGLLYSLFLTLFFLPAAYSIGAGKKSHRER